MFLSQKNKFGKNALQIFSSKDEDEFFSTSVVIEIKFEGRTCLSKKFS